MRVTVRHLVERSGAFYYQATPAMRRTGIASVPLGRDRAEAIRLAEKYNAAWDATRAGEDAPKTTHGTIRWLVRQYEQSPAYRRLAAKSKREIDRLLAILTKTIGDERAAAVERWHIKQFHREQADAVSGDHANRLVKELRKLLFLAMDEGLRNDNPARNLRLAGTPGRDAVWSPIDVSLFVAMADRLGRPSLGTAALLMYELAQSPIDARLMPWSAYQGGVVTFRRSKTSKAAAQDGRTSRLIEVPATQRLIARLGNVARKGPQIVLSEETGRPYTEYDFSHWCRYVRFIADLPPDLKMMDLRRSRAVHLAEAGATTAEVVAVTGHSIERGERILEVYLPRSGAMAASAVAKGEKRTKFERDGK